MEMGIHLIFLIFHPWIPAFAGMTEKNCLIYFVCFFSLSLRNMLYVNLDTYFLTRYDSRDTRYVFCSTLYAKRYTLFFHRFLSAFNYFINQSIFLRLLSSHIEISVSILLYFFKFLPGMMS